MSSQEGQGGQKHADESRLSERDRLREEIRSLLRYHYRPTEIYKKLNLPRSTYYRHLRAIRKEDREYIDKLRGTDFASWVRLTIEALEDSSRQLAAIAQNAPRDSDRIAALELRYQILLDILNVAKVGPSAVPIVSHLRQARDFSGTFQNKSQ